MTSRPSAPGYLANLMARLFHEVSGEGLAPLGIRPEQFPVLVELWFGPGASRASLVDSLEFDAAGVDALVGSLAADGLILGVPAEPAALLVLTAKGSGARDAAIAAARRANQAAAVALSEEELAAFMQMMNRVIDALKAAKS